MNCSSRRIDRRASSSRHRCLAAASRSAQNCPNVAGSSRPSNSRGDFRTTAWCEFNACGTRVGSMSFGATSGSSRRSHESSCSRRNRIAAVSVVAGCGPTGPGHSPHGDVGSESTRTDPNARRSVCSRNGTIPMGLCHADTIRNRQRSGAGCELNGAVDCGRSSEASRNSGVCRNDARGVRDHNECQRCRS